ncbi:MAG: aminotransferase class III-fold pyridoxal phosphate-dependent enzyme [Phycisphaerales bacterium]|nr:aminotransferase class III-fold pyridoxal phosphate-dependent enzyme [Phycisphaerales bacterium]
MSQIGDAAGNRQGLPLSTLVDYMPFYDEAAAARTGVARQIDMACQHLQSFIERYPKQYACFIFELVQGEGGFNTAPREYFVELMKLCKQHGIAVWDDEVQTFGRTTSMYAYDALGLGEYVDLVTIGKMTQACATLFTEAYNPGPGLLSATFTSSGAACRAGTYIVNQLRRGDYYGDNGRIARHHKAFREHVQALVDKHPAWFPAVEPGVLSPAPAALHGGCGGMMRFTPFGGRRDKINKALKTCFEEGVVLFSCGHGPYHIRMLPPLGVMRFEDWPRVFECVERGLGPAPPADRAFYRCTAAARGGVVFVIRRARVEDVGTLLKLAKMVHFINLPPDRDAISTKVAVSRESFLRAASGSERRRDARKSHGGAPSIKGLTAGLAETDQFMFVLESADTGSVLGTSQLIAHMGGPGNPNYSLKLERRNFFADDIKTGTSHMVAKLHKDETGPTEIGGLILQPASRGAKLGRLLSFVRFHFIGMRRELFADRVLAEMMAPITDDGRSLFWEYLGRRFIPLSYAEADTQCARSRLFISALLPHEDLYLSLLPPEARDVVGTVHRETAPARRLLENLGFAFKDFVDPFDAGPQLEAPTDSIPLIGATEAHELGEPVTASRCKREGILSMLHNDGEFYAIYCPFATDAKGRVGLTAEAMKALRVGPGDELGVTDMTDGMPRGESEPAKSTTKPSRRSTGPDGGAGKRASKREKV